MKSFRIILILFVLFANLGCRSYRANVMFQIDDASAMELTSMKMEAEQNYRINKNDFLTIDVYTNNGERIIDPDFELMESIQRANQQNRVKHQYLVMETGNVKLPVVGEVNVAGMTLNEAEKILEESYSMYYNDVYVILKYNNKRVIVLGAMGGHVIPLHNENTNLLEVLALAGGIGDNAKSYNLRLIRGDLNNPEVQVIDLSTIKGMRQANLNVQPNDVIYVEPVRRTVPETLRDISPVLSLFTTVVTLFVLIRSL